MDKEQKFWEEYRKADSLVKQKMIGKWFEPKPLVLGSLIGGFISIMVAATVLSAGISMLAPISRASNQKKISYHIPLNPG